MQKFTRPITREIELAGERLTVTLSADGISVRPVGSRSAPREVSWAAVLCGMVGEAKTPSPQEVTAAVAALKKPPGGKKAPAGAEEKHGEQAAAATPPADPVRVLLDRLEHWLAAHRPRLLQALRPGANEVELHQMQAQTGVETPAALRTLLSWHNGQGEEFAGRFEEDWLLMGTEEIVAARKDLDRGAGGNGAGNGWQPMWIPFLDDDAGDYLCLDTSLPDAPVREFSAGNKESPAIAPSLKAWLEDFVTAVEQGQYHEEPERGTFLRRRRAAE